MLKSVRITSAMHILLLTVSSYPLASVVQNYQYAVRICITL